ncbi:hypothetical protein LCGC14_1172980 [marine sediment metagenome]|uniref:Uncharacterized protein n=1 Tax=marine sediment metagenome TaxID=412755 RepID=A0A0F9PUT8_9ZZZZ
MPEAFNPDMPRRGKRSKYEKHMYYRKPDRGSEANWITVKGRKHGKQDRLEDYKGFTPLKQFGELIDGHTNQWESIFLQEGGPEAFPVDQVLTLRWYNPADLPTDCSYGNDDDPPCPYMMKLKEEGVKFPQLEGHKVVELFCPECDRAPFGVVNGVGGIGPLARHLSTMHDWDADRMAKYGEKVGIDFDEAYSSERQSKTWEFGGAESPSVRADFSCECGWAPNSEKDVPPQKQLRGHQLGAHKEPVTA